MQLHSQILSGILIKYYYFIKSNISWMVFQSSFEKKKHVNMYNVCFRLGNTKKTFMYVTIKKKIATLIMSQINLRQKVF